MQHLPSDLETPQNDNIANVTQGRIPHSCDEMLPFREVIQRGKGTCRVNAMGTMVHNTNSANISKGDRVLLCY